MPDGYFAPHHMKSEAEIEAMKTDAAKRKKKKKNKKSIK